MLFGLWIFSRSLLPKTLIATVILSRVDSRVDSKPFLFSGSRACVPGRYLVTSEAVGSREVRSDLFTRLG